MAHILQFWWVLALISGVGLASRNVMFKLASARIDPVLGATVLSLSMAATAILFFLYQRYIAHSSPITPTDYDPAQFKAGVLLAVLSGVGVALANIFLAYTFQAGGPASLTAILQNALALSLTIVIGALLLGEVIHLTQLIGIALAVSGIILIVRG